MASQQIAFVALSVLSVPGTSRECAPNPTAPVLDHAVVVTSDLDAAADRFRAHGFRLKQGRLHPNNLLNRHVKFRDGSSLELMTVAGEPGDAMARDYAHLAAAGDGGVYVALRVANVNRPQDTADALGLQPRTSRSGPWQFIGFDRRSQAGALFFISGVAAVQDPDSILTHDPEVSGLAEAWVEGGPHLIALLEELGASHCGQARAPDGRLGERLLLSRGSIVVVPPRDEANPRVLGAVLALRRADTNANVIWPQSNFWVGYTYVAP